MRVVILAGGKGTRLAPYTTVLPKPLMPIGEQPILEVELRQLRHFGFTDVTIAVGHLANLIMAFFGDGSQLGLQIRYAIEDSPRGTIGPLAGIAELAAEGQPFLLMNGDTLTDLDFRAFADAHVQSDALVSVATYAKKVSIDLGVMEVDGRHVLTGFREKPVIPFNVSMGIYMVGTAVLTMIPRDRVFGFDDLMYACLREKRPVRAHPHDGIWLDIGRPDDYRLALETFEQHRSRLCPWEGPAA